MTCCPYKVITPDVWELLDAAELAEKGSWYEPGGWGSQPAIAVNAIRLVWPLKQIAESELKASYG